MVFKTGRGGKGGKGGKGGGIGGGRGGKGGMGGLGGGGRGGKGGRGGSTIEIPAPDAEATLNSQPAPSWIRNPGPETGQAARAALKAERGGVV